MHSPKTHPVILSVSEGSSHRAKSLDSSLALRMTGFKIKEASLLIPSPSKGRARVGVSCAINRIELNMAKLLPPSQPSPLKGEGVLRLN